MLDTLMNGHVSASLAFLGMPGGAEWILIALFGLLIFGKRLPEVGRSLGKGIVEFKKGLKGVEEEVEEAASRPQLAQSAQQTLPPGQAPQQPVEGSVATPGTDAGKA